MGRFITVLKDQEGVITEFDDALWNSIVEKMVVKSKADVTVVFKDGTEMKAESGMKQIRHSGFMSWVFLICVQSANFEMSRLK